MKTLLTLLFTIGTAQAQMKVDTYYLPAIDVGLEKSSAQKNTDLLKYAVSTPIKGIYHINGKSPVGDWTQMFDGSWEYRLRLKAENATSLNVGMTDFFLPHSAELWVSTDDQKIMRGPYNDTYNKNHGFFWVGDVPADHLNIKITVSAEEKPYLRFNVDNITRGFYQYWQEPSYLAKSGSCNVDVACPEAEGWEEPIDSVGQYVFTMPNGSFVCTGQVVNNTAEDGTPYFLTADHCGYSSGGTQSPLSERQNVAASISIIWNYQSLTCRAPGSGVSGTQISRSGFNDRQAGATYIASNPFSDFSLVLLNEIPLSNYGVIYTGWDHSADIPDSAVTIHHPAGHAKRISFENDPLSITGKGTSDLDDEAYFRVEDWDLGTTEGGSSGGGLWNQDQLLVGQLFGGAAACGNDEPDWYGRFNKSWDAGSDAESRLKDWLDPEDTGQSTLGSFTGCEPPTVSIVNNSTNQVGDNLSFSSQVSGGTGGYTYEWDLNGDRSVEGTNGTYQARFNQSFVGNISLTVRDSSGCGIQTSQALIISGADVQLEDVVNIRENLDQVCGNNDSVIDPGERWSTLLQARNIGNATGSAAYLAMGKNRSDAGDEVSDNYGNQAAVCNRLFIDISTTGTFMPWEAAPEVSNTTAEDEGSVLIQLSESFDHYGQSIDQIRVSTNGFISTSPNATGGDWDNDCPLPQSPDKDDEGARIAVLHDDYRNAMFYHQSFSSCPRQSDFGDDLACEVFLWQGADQFETTEIESIDIQAILYPSISQWVFQYSGSGFNGSTSTTGMQNESANDGLNFACNTANSVNTTDAVCIFNKNNLLPTSNLSNFMVESPVISLGDMNINEVQSRNLNFAIAEDAQCGASFGIDHQASVYDEGFNAGQANILTQEIGSNGQCNVVTNCGVGNSSSFVSNNIEPRRGLWWNPDRGGNGFDWYTLNQSNLVYIYYTGDQSGEPVWYLASDADSKHNQYFNNITRYEAEGGFGNGDLSFDTVGWSNTSFIDDSNAIQVREIDGLLSAEKLYFFQYGPDQTPNLHTGLYFTPSEGGWGQSVGTLGDARVVINYLYDDSGQPYWTIASGPNDSSVMDAFYFKTFCPSCPAIGSPGVVVGGVSLSLNGQTDGTLNSFNVSDDNVNWSRSNLPVVNLIPPED